jgi:lipopolysaccharide transport system ATP-binding protein
MMRAGAREMSDIIISVQNLSKRYMLGREQGQRERYVALRDVIMGKARGLARSGRDFLGRQSAPAQAQNEEFWALKNVSFDVRRGEVIGIIGRNGAGKSTLLKVLSRITDPTAGRVELRGRVASLLEVGTGFHPELTGRENIYLNGAILGMAQAEVRRKFDEIVAFAEVERFLDTPVKRYSSGMYVRLAFSVAAHLEPEILIVDEVLAVGDAEFQKKCLGKMDEVSRQGGRTVIFVSHNMGVIANMCPTTIWLEKGRAHMTGASRKIVNEYLSKGVSTEDKVLQLVGKPRSPGMHDDRLRIESVEWLTPIPLRHGEPVEVLIRFRTRAPVAEVSIGIGFSGLDGKRLLTYDTDFASTRRADISSPGLHKVLMRIDSLPLAPDLYSLDVGSRSSYRHGLDYVSACAQIEVIPGENTPAEIVVPGAGVRLESRNSWHLSAPQVAPPKIAAET